MGFYYTKGASPRCIGGDNATYAEASGFIKSTLSDNFATLDTERWGVYSPIAGATISINGSGQLVIPISTTANGTPALESLNLYSLVSQTLTLDIVQHITGTNDEEYFMITDGVGKGYAFLYQNGAGTSLLCRIFGADGVTQLVTQYNAAPGAGVTKWRFRHTTAGGGNGTLFLETWNGATWDTRLSTVINWSVATFGCTIKTNRFGAQGTAADFIVDNLTLTGESANVPVANDTKKFTKTSGGNAFNCGVYSIEYIESALSDQSVRTKLTGLGRRRISFARETDLPPTSAGAFEIECNEDGNIYIYEFGTLVNTPGYAWGVGNEIRVQAVNVSGTYRVRYWWRAKSASAEQQMYQTSVTSANILACFPLHAKALIYTQGAAIDKLSIEDNTGSNPGNILAVSNSQTPPAAIEGIFPLSLTGGVGGAALPNHSLFYKGATLSTATNGLIVFRPLKDWKMITGIKLSILDENINSVSSREFNIKKNGADLFSAHELTIPANVGKVDLTNLSFVCSPDDVFILNYLSSGKSMSSPIFLELTVS